MKMIADIRHNMVIYAKLSEKAYENLRPGVVLDRPDLAGWSVYDVEDDTAQSGYFGVLFKHDATKRGLGSNGTANRLKRFFVA